MKNGRRLGAPPKPYQPPVLPAGLVNTTDSDSRLKKMFGPHALQGYNAQVAVNERQILLAAEVTVTAPDFGQLEPMVAATGRELDQGGFTAAAKCPPTIGRARASGGKSPIGDHGLVQRSCPAVLRRSTDVHCWWVRSP